MADSPSPFSTPKRKRTSLNDLGRDAAGSPPPPSGLFSFAVNAGVDVPVGNSPSTATNSGSNSPRSRVAHRFRGLALGDNPVNNESTAGVAKEATDAGHADTAGVATAADSMMIDEDESMMRKRSRISPAPPNQTGNTETTDAICTPHPSEIAPPQAHEGHPQLETNTGEPIVLDETLFTSSPKPSPAKLSRPQHSLVSNRTLEALRGGGKGRKRIGMLPLGTTNKGGHKNSLKSTTAYTPGIVDPLAEAEVIDPVRAALTWQEDEITIYDPEDEDDDGVGINGIGFKPTPAIAHARTMRRRQQLAEYKKREEREARARRSLRRRGGSPQPAQTGRAPPEPIDNTSRKVRFTETEPSVMIETL